MKVIIAGSRHLFGPAADKLVVIAVARSGWADKVTTVVSGAAHGIDAAGERWAAGRELPVRLFPADWAKYGRRAGPLRNAEMAQYADALVAIPHAESRGTRDMIRAMKKLGKPVFVMEAHS